MSNKIEIIRGDTHVISLTFKDDNGVAIDIGGVSVTLTVKGLNDVKTNDDDAIIQKVITSHTDATNGLTEVFLSASETEKTAGLYYYDLQLLYPDWVKTSIDRWYFEILDDTTKS